MKVNVNAVNGKNFSWNTGLNFATNQNVILDLKGPEQYGVNASTLFCEAEHKEHKCAKFLQKPLNAKYYCGDVNTPLFSNDVSFQLITPNPDEDFAYITDEANVFNVPKSLAFNNWNGLEILLPQPTIMTGLKLSN